MSATPDLRFHKLAKAEPLGLMCPNCREGGLTKTYGDGNVAGCTLCSAKWMQRELEKWNLELLLAKEIRGEQAPDGKGPLAEWWAKMTGRRTESQAKKKTTEEQRHDSAIRAAQLANARSRG